MQFAEVAFTQSQQLVSSRLTVTCLHQVAFGRSIVPDGNLGLPACRNVCMCACIELYCQACLSPAMCVWVCLEAGFCTPGCTGLATSVILVHAACAYHKDMLAFSCYSTYDSRHAAVIRQQQYRNCSVAALNAFFYVQAYSRHSLSRAALLTAGAPIFLMDTYTSLILYYTAGYPPDMPFPPPPSSALRKAMQSTKHSRQITPQLKMLRGTRFCNGGVCRFHAVARCCSRSFDSYLVNSSAFPTKPTR